MTPANPKPAPRLEYSAQPAPKASLTAVDGRQLIKPTVAVVPVTGIGWGVATLPPDGTPIWHAIHSSREAADRRARALERKGGRSTRP